MIILRELLEKDAELMLEWMHDIEIQKSFKKNMLAATLEDARNFCINSRIPDSISNGDNLHFAITDETDEYLGTISLKNIDMDSMTAEYAITTRKKANGKGIGFIATSLILKKAFYDYGLHRVYLCVLADNDSAINLYERCGFRFEGEFREHIKKDGHYLNWKWYGMLDNEFDINIFE